MHSGKHILILSSWYPTSDQPFLGNFIVRQANLLARNHKVTLIDTVALHESEEIRIEKNRSENFQEILVFHGDGKGIISKRNKRREALHHVFRSIEKPDLIIGNILLPKGWEFVEAKKYFKVPLIYVEHGSYFRKDSPYKWTWKDRLILQSMKNQADAIVAVSDFLKERLDAVFPKADVQVIGNHIDEELFFYKEKKKDVLTRFLHVSTLDKNTKNPKGIIEACRILKGKDPDFQMTIISDESYSYWEELVVELGIEKQVRFLGPLEWKELPPYYHEADAFVLFSEYETFSIVLAEALATGTPIITTRVGLAAGLPEDVITFVEEGNEVELADAMYAHMQGKKISTEALIKIGKQYTSVAILEKWNKLIASYVG